MDRREFWQTHSRIERHDQLRSWIRQSRNPDWIITRLSETEGVTVDETFLAAYAVLRHIPARDVRIRTLVDWKEIPHNARAEFPAQMLRAEENLRLGIRVSQEVMNRLNLWKRRLQAANQVVEYRPGCSQPWRYVPRRPGVDNDLIRDPNVP